MNLNAFKAHKFFLPFVGAGLTALCGLLLLWTAPEDGVWVNSSYDSLFRFGSRSVTNKPVLVLMDDDSYATLGQTRANWNRALHAKLLNRLAAGGSALAVFDVFFGSNREAASDAVLAQAMRTHGGVVLRAKLHSSGESRYERVEIEYPYQLFMEHATNWGIAKVNTTPRGIPRKHWPFPAPYWTNFYSLPWTAAVLAGAKLGEEPRKQWLRYYGERGAWETLSFTNALSKVPDYFRGKTVFIGSSPETSDPAQEETDKFRTPYTTRYRGMVAGIEILVTEFLNLVNGDWLRRPSEWVETVLLFATGALLGGGLCLLRPLPAIGLALLAGVLVMLGAVCWSYYSNFWFPWLLISGGQVPCALAWSIGTFALRLQTRVWATATTVTERGAVQGLAPSASGLPDASDYTIFDPPFGAGGFGKVWLVRNSIGQWQALKAVYQSSFGDGSRAFEMEFAGIQSYKPISNEHPGLLHVDFVSAKKPGGYFYYVMELGDALEEGWEQNPTTYRPRDLKKAIEMSPTKRLPARECVSIALTLAEALEYLHQRGLTHRDIKPSNIIFVKGQPKLADVGLVAQVRLGDTERSRPGTPGYMPPPPEQPGSPAADIYGLGMVLYVMRTGREPVHFPEVSTSLVENTKDFMRLNAVILKACQPDRTQKYSSAAEMHAALLTIQKEMAE